MAVAALLALPLQAEAQKTTFVSNTGQSTDPDVREVGPHGHLWQLQAQQFRTGDNEGGYTLSAIQVRVDDFGSNSRPKVSIYTTSSGNPGTSLYVLTNPATLNDDAINTFRAPANATLEKDTNYFVVFEELGSGSNLRYDLEVTTSNAEDSGKASGWNIANSSRQRSTTITTWSDLAGKLKIAVRGTLPPALSIADASAAENVGHLLFEVTLSRSFQNTVKVDFETISGGTATEGEDYHARRKYTHVILAGDRTAQMGFALIEDTVAAAGETVKVRLSNARVVDAYGDKIKDLDITTDEATGTITAPATTTTNVSNLNIRIQDASADEDDGWLDFRVRLSRKYDDYVCYDFETISGGTATEGRDYSKRPKVGQWVQIGKRVDKPFVRIIDDAINDDGETVKVKISNARLCNDASQTVSIANAEATGTINNSDPMPLAWMVRFGRTVGSQVVDALGQRLDGGTASHVTVGGINLTGAPGAAPEAQSDDPYGLPEWAKGTQREESQQSLTANELLLGSTFHLSWGGGQGGGAAAYTAWGRVARSGFETEVDDVTMDADVTSGLIGFDAEWERVLAGVMLSQSTGEGSYRLNEENGGRTGTVESSLTGVYPYARLELNRQVSAWALAGTGSGEFTLQQEGKKPMPTDITMRMGAVGFKGQVLDGTGASGLAMNVKSDAMWVGTQSERTADMVATQGDVTRLRLIVEGERAFTLAVGGTFTPSAQLGLRHDGGDTETGTGVEVGAGLRYTVDSVTVEAEARTLVAHEDSAYKEWGASAAIRVTPDPSGRGLTLSIAPAWGQTGSGAQRLWSARDASGLGTDSEFEATSRLDIDAGYGFGLRHSRGVLTPYAGFTLGDGGARTLRTGTRWQLTPDAVFGLERTRRADSAGEGENEVLLRAALRF